MINFGRRFVVPNLRICTAAICLELALMHCTEAAEEGRYNFVAFLFLFLFYSMKQTFVICKLYGEKLHYMFLFPGEFIF